MNAIQKHPNAILAAIICLAACGQTVLAQNTVTITPSAGVPNPNPVAPQAQATSALTATASNPPMAGYGQQIQDPVWEWNIQSVQFSPSPGGSFSTAAQDTYSVLIDQTQQSAADATLTASFSQVGVYHITAHVTVSYTDLPETDTWTGSAPVDLMVTVAQTAPTPSLSLVADKYAICAGAKSDAVHQATLTATVTDGQGNPTPNASVAFTTTDGSLSSASGTTGMNGQVTTTLTSSINASDDQGQWKAAVTATLSSQTDATATANIEFQPPNMSLKPNTPLLGDGESTNVILTLTWNGMPVQGHGVGWRISRIWDVDEILRHCAKITYPFGGVISADGSHSSIHHEIGVF